MNKDERHKIIEALQWPGTINDVHVVPVFEGEPRHEESGECFCSPTLDYENPENGKKLWIHHRPQ